MRAFCVNRGQLPFVQTIGFGSDWPMTSPAEEIRAIDALGLSDGETKLVLGGTLARVLGIESSWS